MAHAGHDRVQIRCLLPISLIHRENVGRQQDPPHCQRMWIDYAVFCLTSRLTRSTIATICPQAPRTSPDEIELQVAQAILDLETNVPDLKAELRPLQISAAREVDVKGGRKAIVVFLPMPQVKAFHKVQGRYVIESCLSSTCTPAWSEDLSV